MLQSATSRKEKHAFQMTRDWLTLVDEVEAFGRFRSDRGELHCDLVAGAQGKGLAWERGSEQRQLQSAGPGFISILCVPTRSGAHQSGTPRGTTAACSAEWLRRRSPPRHSGTSGTGQTGRRALAGLYDDTAGEVVGVRQTRRRVNHT